MMHENETAAASRAAETPAAPTSAGSPVQLMTAAEVLAAVDEIGRAHV